MSENSCGQPNALQKVAAAVEKDRSIYVAPRPLTAQQEPSDRAEYFEFAQRRPAEWASEFISTNNANEPFFESRFKSPMPTSWIQEFASSAGRHTDTSSSPTATATTTTTTTTTTTNSSWVHEFSALNIQQPDETRKTIAESWVDEFKAHNNSNNSNNNENADEDKELRATAAGILRNLEHDQDPKLTNSRFVAYLKQLAGATEPTEFEAWKATYMQNIEPLIEDREWTNMQKSWETYESTGYGYKDFARREFGTYHLSVPASANPHHQVSDKLARLPSADHKARILLLEAAITETPDDARAWRLLGQAQQANEIDAQAIAAFLRATALDPNDSDAWLGLAASCANESCIPDALDALRSLLGCFPQFRAALPRLQGQTPRAYADAFAQLAASAPHCPRNVLIAASILHNLTGNHVGAVELLQSLPADGDWTISNRLGASLANSQQYERALQVYDRLLADGHDYPRVRYNKGISLMCTDQHLAAGQNFVHAIEGQVPVDIVSGIRDELVASYTAPWDALRVNFSIAGRDSLANCDPSNLALIKSSLGMQ